MVKYLTQHTDIRKFFLELEENEIFMYSYLDFTWEDIIKLAEENNVKIEHIVKGTDEYRKYGECTARVIKMRGKVYEFRVNFGETVKIEAKTEEAAREKLIDYLFKNKLITLNKVS